MKSFHLAILACSLIGGLCVSGCGKPTNHTTAGSYASSITVTDLAGREVTLRQPIKRIVLMRSFQLHELGLLLGDEIEEKLVGWDSSAQTGYRDTYLKYVERYPGLESIAVLGDALNDDVSVESVIALKPDLVIMHTFMLDSGLKFVPKLEEAGLPLLFLSTDDPFEDPQKSILLLGKVLNKEKRAREIVDFIDHEIRVVEDGLTKARGPKPTVYVEASSNGLEYGTTFGSNMKGGWGVILDKCRGDNIALGHAASRGAINPEYLLSANPDVIVVLGAWWTDAPKSLRLGYLADPAPAKTCLSELKERPGWKQLNAIKDNKLYGLHMRFVGSAIGFAGAQQLCKWLYPDEFEHVDPESRLREFHDRFMPFDYSGPWMVELNEPS